MKILLTNDDGVNAPGIEVLADKLRKAGHGVVVVAPASNQSGVSHSISFFHGPCKLKEIARDTWSCEGSPADCVVIALSGGIPDFVKPDVIVSGINYGANLGTDIIYSGTAAAARQGALFNIPSLALSLVWGDSWYWEMAADFSAANLEQMIDCWKPDSFVNVNIPNRPEKPFALVHAFPSFRYYNDSIDVYLAPDGSRYCFSKAGDIDTKPEQGSDWDAVESGGASLSRIYIHPLLLESVKGEGRHSGG